MEAPRGRSSIAQRLGVNPASAANPGSLYTAFRPYFEYLLHPEHIGETNSDFKLAYVPVPHAEEGLRLFIDAPQSSIAAFIGPRGIGKSTVLRYIFGLGSSPSLFDENTILIPFYLDTISTKFADPDQVILSQILASVTLIKKHRTVTITDDRLAEFIRAHKAQLLEALDLKRDATDHERVAHLKSRNPYAWVAEELKYCVANAGLNRIILLVDDIESAPFLDQKALVQGALKFRDCLKNTGGRRSTYRADFIFTCRASTYEMLQRDSEINGFNIRRNIRFEKPVDLNDIIRNRFELAISALGSGQIGELRTERWAADRGKWQEAFDVLMERLKTTTERHGQIVTELCNYNIREAMTEINYVLMNSRWYERSGPHEGAFDIHDQNYRMTDAGFFRSLILKDREYFSRRS